MQIDLWDTWGLVRENDEQICVMFLATSKMSFFTFRKEMEIFFSQEIQGLNFSMWGEALKPGLEICDVCLTTCWFCIVVVVVVCGRRYKFEQFVIDEMKSWENVETSSLEDVS